MNRLLSLFTVLLSVLLTDGAFLAIIPQAAFAAGTAGGADFAATASTTAAGSPPAPVARLAAEIPPRVKAPTDSAVYRRFVLDNGMRVLLVSDPRFNKSGAALAVNTGHIDDPREREGLAHFLEHMLFLGTEKYPDVAEYGNFINANGGYHNAYTTSDHTNYHFEVRHEALATALDRFAQFFIAPTFNADFTGREVNAVHNEAMRHVQNDIWRIFSVSSELYEPSSVERKFAIGNKDTLAGANAAVVRAFYESHYTADQMALALAGRTSLDELEKLARANFLQVPQRKVPTPVREARFLPNKPALRLAMIEPVKDVRQLFIEFPVPATRPDFMSHPDRLITEMISDSVPGSLEALLTREGLIYGVSGSLNERTGEYGSVLISATLTPAGYEQYSRVLGLIYSYLQFLRDAPFPSVYYNERARIGQLNETYADRGEGAALATRLANRALFYPLEIAERAPDIWGRPDPAAYRRLLGALTPDNALVSLVAKGVTTNRRERIYDVAAERYAALKEASLRGLKSYEQTEAYVLARDRRDAFMREFHYLPVELIARTTAASWPDVREFARRFFARGKIESLVHGQTSRDDAVAMMRAVASRIGAQPAPAAALLRRRHLDIARSENVIDAGEINGVNSAWLYTKNNPPAEVQQPAFSDRAAWKSTRHFQ